jgi:hypothetical protein
MDDVWTTLEEDYIFMWGRAGATTRGGLHKAIYALHLKFRLCAHPFFTNLL